MAIFRLLNSWKYCPYISLAAFLAALPLCFARYIHSSTTLTFRTLYSWKSSSYISCAISMAIWRLFHINTFSQDEKRSALPNFSLYACLFKILKKQPTRAAGKKILLKFKNMFKYLYMISQQQTRKFTKHELFHYGVLEPC